MEYLRVSEILTPFTGIEFVDDDLLQKAASRGTRAHYYIEQFLLSGNFGQSVNDDCVEYLQSFSAFWKGSAHLFKDCKLELEKRLFDDDLFFTGKIDCIFSKPGRTYLVDWKTSSKFHDSWYLQGAAYQHLLRKNGYDNVDEVLFVHLKKGKKPSLYKDSEQKKHLDIFLKCLELYRYFRMDVTRKKNIKEKT